MDLSLVMFKADGTRRDFPITKDRVVVGRTNTCDLRIPLSSVSRQHCELVVDGEQVRVRDLGSSNGTYHNDIRVEEARLDAGDEISVGPVVFTLVKDGEPGSIQPVRTIIDAEESGAMMGDEPVALGESGSSRPAPVPQPKHPPAPQEEEAGIDMAGGNEAEESGLMLDPDAGSSGVTEGQEQVRKGDTAIAFDSDMDDDDALAALEELSEFEDDENALPLLDEDEEDEQKNG